MKISSFVWVLGVVILGGSFLFFLSTNKASKTIPSKGTLPVTVEVFSDYNCPHCADFAPFVEDVKAVFGDKVDIQKKQSPFLADSSSGYAYAAEAARDQGAFEDFDHQIFAWITYLKDSSNTKFTYSENDKSFYSQSVDVTKLAERLNLDIEKFNLDRKSSTIVNRVQDQKADLTKRMGSVSTPAVFIYGELFSMSTYDELKIKVQELITDAENKLNNEIK